MRAPAASAGAAPARTCGRCAEWTPRAGALDDPRGGRACTPAAVSATRRPICRPRLLPLEPLHVGARASDGRENRRGGGHRPQNASSIFFSGPAGPPTGRLREEKPPCLLGILLGHAGASGGMGLHWRASGSIWEQEPARTSTIFHDLSRSFTAPTASRGGVLADLNNTRCAVHDHKIAIVRGKVKPSLPNSRPMWTGPRAATGGDPEEPTQYAGRCALRVGPLDSPHGRRRGRT